jgi:hypothetical protein
MDNFYLTYSLFVLAAIPLLVYIGKRRKRKALALQATPPSPTS